MTLATHHKGGCHGCNSLFVNLNYLFHVKFRWNSNQPRHQFDLRFTLPQDYVSIQCLSYQHKRLSFPFRVCCSRTRFLLFPAPYPLTPRNKNENKKVSSWNMLFFYTQSPVLSICNTSSTPKRTALIDQYRSS